MDVQFEDHEISKILSLLTQLGSGSMVKAYLTLRNISQNELAIKLGISATELSRVVNGKRRTRWIQDALATELGIPSEVLFRHN